MSAVLVWAVRVLLAFIVFDAAVVVTLLLLAYRREENELREFPPITQLRAADPMLDGLFCCEAHRVDREIADLEQLWTTS